MGQDDSRGSAGAVGVILAAGSGERLGRGPKAYVSLDGGPTLLDRAVAMMSEAGLRPIVVVLPEGPDPVSLPTGTEVVRNPHVDTGPLGSAALALEHLVVGSGLPSVAILHPVDHPHVTADDVRCLVDGAMGAAAPVARVVPVWDGTPGHPIAVCPPGIAAIRAAGGNGKALREVLRGAGRSLRVAAATAGVLRNVNDPRDL